MCPYFYHLRQEFIPPCFYMYPSEIKFKLLMNKDNIDLKTKNCQYIVMTLKLRYEILDR